MRDGGRIAAAIEVLTEVETRRVPTRMAIRSWSERSRFAGSKDRAFVSGLVLDALRKRRSLAWRMGDDSPRAAVLAVLGGTWRWSVDRLAEAAIVISKAGSGEQPLTRRQLAEDRGELSRGRRGEHQIGAGVWLAQQIAAASDAAANASGERLARRALVLRRLRRERQKVA